MLGSVRPVPVHHREGAGETLQLVRAHREVSSSSGWTLRPQPWLRLHLLRHRGGRYRGPEDDGRQGVGREADPRGLLDHEAAPHPDPGDVHGQALAGLRRSRRPRPWRRLQRRPGRRWISRLPPQLRGQGQIQG